MDLVRWLEKAPIKSHSSRFLVVFSDGTISFFHKDVPVPSNLPKTADSDKEPKPYDADKDFLKFGD